MIKRTLYFGNPAYLSLQNEQLVIKLPQLEKNESLPKSFKEDNIVTIPVEDIGIVLLDNRQITITQGLLAALTDNNTAILNCNTSHLPQGLMLPMYGHHAYTEKIKYQIDASLPLKKNLWQQTIAAKIKNQAALLESWGVEVQKMKYWAASVRSGDPNNYEARAAAYFWSAFAVNFKRERFGEPPNNLLNYGYAVLRAVVARALVASGCIPALGIHHRNKYNPFCLADDIMEPYRPFVDNLVISIAEQHEDIEILTPDIKRELLTVPTIDIEIEKKISPLMVGIQRTTASLMKCFEGEQRKILYPELKI
ncbi:MAG: type II CRISPR-associated endonuclease Cas1 [Bacteroidales bacterium]|nr:type II CRISPR-associated endonuclease Cas1 [Bacteroidales bacterium]